MATPQSKKSKMRVRLRKAANRFKGVAPTLCTNAQCGAPCLPHRVCKKCGSYNGRQVMNISAAAQD